jgi:hypothetical protein
MKKTEHIDILKAYNACLVALLGKMKEQKMKEQKKRGIKNEILHRH